LKKNQKLPTVDFSKWGNVTIEKTSTLRQKISDKMTSCWQNIPHVTQFDEANITELMKLRKKHNPKYEKENGKLTMTVLLIRAVEKALDEFPNFNASLNDKEIVIKSYKNIGIAVDTPSGLIVPVIKEPGEKSFLDIAQELTSIAEKARDRSLSRTDLEGGTFTISNLGGLGVGHFTPIINHPEVAILGVGRGSKKLQLNKDGKIEEILSLPLALSYDHRIIDGADGARFIKSVIKNLESISEKDMKVVNTTGEKS
jgi:Pyruvate/2-oxoglutarate dehydrogenase complex, dihydrolipoamide acyltransferase (E2) component, and related enzymes